MEIPCGYLVRTGNVFDWFCCKCCRGDFASVSARQHGIKCQRRLAPKLLQCAGKSVPFKPAVEPIVSFKRRSNATCVAYRTRVARECDPAGFSLPESAPVLRGVSAKHR